MPASRLVSCFIALGLTFSGAQAYADTTKTTKSKSHKTSKAAPAKVAAKHKASIRRVAAKSNELSLRSNVALVLDQTTGQTVVAKNVNDVHPIASISKLMTAQVILDAMLPMNERITITEGDKDTERNSSSRLRIGAEMTRAELLQMALMSSENRAAHALGRTFPGGMPAFVQQMNLKAKALGMTSSHFVEPTGLSSENVSTAADLVKLAHSADRYAVIREYTTTASRDFEVLGRVMRFNNTNHLVGSDNWNITLSKTGYISEAGRCLVMQARIEGRPLTIVLLDSSGRLTRIGDANRIRKWLSSQPKVASRSGEAAGG